MGRGKSTVRRKAMCSGRSDSPTHDFSCDTGTSLVTEFVGPKMTTTIPVVSTRKVIHLFVDVGALEDRLEVEPVPLHCLPRLQHLEDLKALTNHGIVASGRNKRRVYIRPENCTLGNHLGCYICCDFAGKNPHCWRMNERDVSHGQGTPLSSRFS